jgi:hypothetical protein
MRHVLPLLFAPFLLAATPAGAFSEAALIDGFERTVFGAEYASRGRQALVVKKFVGAVRVHIEDRSQVRRGGEVEAFVRSLPDLVRGLAIDVVADAAEANYRIFVLDRADYRRVVSREVYRRPSSSFAPGQCLVRVASTAGEITGSDAVIVADEGELLFRRCMVEEILQGLGPVNDDATLAESVFNDSSPHRRFTLFDRHILNMLYHPLIRPGMTLAEARAVLPAVAREVTARLGATLP